MEDVRKITVVLEEDNEAKDIAVTNGKMKIVEKQLSAEKKKGC